MAEKKCKSCAMMIPKEAKLCPYCRKPQGITTCAAMGLLLIGLIAIGGIIGTVTGPPQNGDPLRNKQATGLSTTSEEELPKLAFYRAQKEVAAYLKAPSSAKFDSYDETAVKKLGGDKSFLIFEVNSYVDSQNAFGAMLRTKYTCTLVRHLKNGAWTLEGLKTY